MRRTAVTGMSVAVVFGCAAIVAGQSATTDKKADNMKPMSMMGCLEAGSTPGSYMLTHMEMGKMKKSTSDSHAATGQSATAAMPDKMMLMGGKPSNMSKEMGHKVVVTGTKDTSGSMMVKSMKMMSATCP